MNEACGSKLIRYNKLPNSLFKFLYVLEDYYQLATVFSKNNTFYYII